MSTEVQMKPVFLIAPGSITKRDIKRIEKLSGVVVAECSNAGLARFLEPPITAVPLEAHAAAAIKLARHIVNTEQASFYKADLVRWFVQMLISQPGIDKVAAIPKK